MNTNHDACSLPAGAQIKRLKTIQTELSQVNSQYRTAGVRRYTFAPDADRLGRLEALVAAEKACCSFLQIDLHDAENITLTIAGPESFLAQLERNEINAPWGGVALAGVVAMATCTLPLALGAAAVWIEGGGFVLLLVAAVMLAWRFWKNRSAATGLNTQTK